MREKCHLKRGSIPEVREYLEEDVGCPGEPKKSVFVFVKHPWPIRLDWSPKEHEVTRCSPWDETGT